MPIKVQPQAPDIYVANKVPLKVTLLIPQSTLDYTNGEKLQTMCIGGTVPPTPYGNVFKETVAGTFTQVFEEVVVVDTMPSDDYQIVFEATLKNVGYKVCCPIDPECKAIVTGNLRAINTKGNDTWLSSSTSGSKSMPPPMSFTMSGVIKSYSDMFASAFTSLAEQWGNELKSPPHIQQYASEWSFDSGEAGTLVDVKEMNRAYEEANELNTIEGYNNFLADYPRSKHKETILPAIILLIEANEGKEALYAKFADNYPDDIEYLPIQLRLNYTGPPGLKISNIIKLVKQGIGTNIIISKINLTKGKYKNFSTDELFQLKKMGVPDDIVATMLNTTTEALKREEEQKKKKQLMQVTPISTAPVEVGRSTPTVNSQQQSVGQQLGNTAVECTKQKVAIQACDQIGGFAGIACKFAAKAKFKCPI